jgi:hypothetical protein
LRQALVKEKDRKKRSSSKAKQPYDYLDFARRFHRVRDNSSAREKMRLSGNASRSTLSSV